jgi:hypothetical protein
MVQYEVAGKHYLGATTTYAVLCTDNERDDPQFYSPVRFRHLGSQQDLLTSVISFFPISEVNHSGGKLCEKL